MIPDAAVTTTVTVLRPASGTDPELERPVPTEVVSGVPAHLSAAGGRGSHAGGDQQSVGRRLGCDPCDLQHFDQVVDDTTGLTYEVVTVVNRSGGPLYAALDHMEADLLLVQGEVARG